MARTALTRLAERVEQLAEDTPFASVSGRVVAASAGGLWIRGLEAHATLGAAVSVLGVPGEIIRLDSAGVFATLYEEAPPIRIGTPVRLAPMPDLRVDDSWSGRVIDPLGRPLDGGPPLPRGAARRAGPAIPAAMERTALGLQFRTGVKAVDVFTPLVFGQRIGIFAGSGVGKSSLLGMLARAPSDLRIVVALVGERGREVREFVETVLGEARARTVTVAATSDTSAMMRRRAPLAAMRIAEHFRDSGRDVLLVMDSVTRFAHACRDVALAAGEPPVARGYPPGVFAELAHLLERAGAGASGQGSITALVTVLVDGDDHNDPVADATRGILDGHIVLSRAIAEQGRFPAIDIEASISRLADRAWTPDQRRLAAKLRSLTARFEETRDLRALGGYQPGADSLLDHAVTLVPKLYQAICQSPGDLPSRDAFQDVANLIAE